MMTPRVLKSIIVTAIFMLFGFALRSCNCELNGKNILHIIVDDLRNEVGAYNLDHRIHTPNMDQLAREGVVFDRAYAQQALCNPSRASFMTGRRPDSTKIWNLNDNWRVHHQDWTSLPEMFKDAGMLSLGSGKTYHDTCQGTLEDLIFEYDDLRSWSKEALPYRNPCWTQGIDCLGCPGTHWSIGNVSEDWCMRAEGDMSDVLTTDHAIDLLNVAVSASKPFYLAVGYHKPHLPWIAKPKHFALYPLETIEVPEHSSLDSTVPEIAFHSTQNSTPTVPLPDDQVKLARRAYYAATTGMDEEVGRLLAALEESGEANNTAIILHGDHGWHLGEYGEWAKSTNWEMAVRTPLLVKVPWMEGIAGTRTAALAELVDLMPTLAELVGAPIPTRAGDLLQPLEGKSLVPALRGEIVHEAVFSQFPRRPKDESIPWSSNGIEHLPPEEFTFMGYSVRVDGWRYTEWYRWNQTTLRAEWDAEDGLYARELYDHRFENTTTTEYTSNTPEVANVVSLSENDYVAGSLSKILRRQFRRLH